MSYIKFQGNPMFSRVNSATAGLCSTAAVKPSLTLTNGTFTITNSDGTTASGFNSFGNIVFPADGYTNLTLEICKGETVQIVNNDLTSDLLSDNRSYTKGILLYVMYPQKDENGAETLPEDYWVEFQYSILDEAYVEQLGSFPIGEAFLHLAPQAAKDSRRLFNTVSIYNPSDKFSVKINAMLIKTKISASTTGCCDC